MLDTTVPQRGTRFRSYGPPILVASLIVLASAIWLATTPIAHLREQLRVSQFWFLDAIVLALGIATGASLKGLTRSLLPAWPTIAAVGSVSVLLVLLAPLTNRIYYDEQIYESVGQNLSDLHLAQSCDEGSVEYGRLQCSRYTYNKQPYGYPHLISVGYRVFGTSDRLPHWTNSILSGATGVTLLLIACLLTRDRRAGIFAALAFSVLPEQLRWARTAASEPSTAFFCSLAILAVAVFAVRRTTGALAWVVLAASVACYFRAEAFLIVPVVVGAVAILAPQELRRPRFLWCCVLGLVLVLPECAHLAAVRNEGWGTTGDRLSLAYFWHNLRTNTLFYGGDGRFPVAISLLVLAGLFVSARISALLCLWFTLFWAVFLFFYAGSYDYGADVRYSVLSYPPLALLAGIGASRATRWLEQSRPDLTRPAAWMAAAIAFQFLWYTPWVRAVGEEAWGARADVAFARRFAATLPRNSIVLTHNPSMFHVWGINAAQLSLASSEPLHVRRDLIQRYAGGVYLHWNFWCNVSDPAQVRFCDQALAAFPSALVAETRERNYRYAFYRVTSSASPR